MKNNNLLSTFAGAFQISVLLLPVHFLNVIVLLKTDYVMIPFVVIPIISALFMGLSVYSKSLKQAFAKIILSIPFTVLFWYVQIKIRFSLRALNWIYPGYGKSSVGGNFADFIILCSLAFCGFIALIIFTTLSAVNLSEKKQTVLFNLQKYLALPVCIAVIAVIIVLNNIMPMYNPLYG